jgi:type II secretory pathway pseudopilin PulG
MRMKSRRMNSPRPVAHSRTGFTMAETLVVLVLLAIVGGSLMNVLTKQQQFYNGTGDLIAMRTQLRQAEAILSGDLRGISSSGGDITTMTDSSIEFNYTIGTSVVCKAPAPNTNTVIIPQTGPLTNGNTLTSWITKPTFGDQAYIFDEGAITTDATTAHYSLHQFADGLWYLGYCSPACGVGIAINPIAGPFRPYAPTTTPDTSGIRMTYYDSTGTVTNVPAQVSRIDITIRGQTAGYVHIEGMTKGVYHDSLSMSIALRNRS